jgi:hypothetical protein
LEIPPPAIGGSSSCGSDAQGDLVNCTLTLPQDTTGGFRRVDASDGTNLTTAPFTITPTARLAPPTGPVGTSVALLGNGFPGGPVPVTFDGAPVPVTPGCTSSELGFLHVPFARDNTCYFTVPPATAGPHRVTVGSLVLCPCLVTLSFTVIPAISLGATSVLPGRADQVSGSGFAAERPITLSLDARGLPTSGNCTTDARGSFVACSVRAEARPGTHTLTATDGTNTASATWSITLNVPRQ